MSEHRVWAGMGYGPVWGMVIPQIMIIMAHMGFLEIHRAKKYEALVSLVTQIKTNKITIDSS